MAVYEVKVYNRGMELYEVEATSEQEALDTWYQGDLTYSEVIEPTDVVSLGVVND